MIPQYVPLIEPADCDRVRRQVESTFVGSGKVVAEFERVVAAESGIRHCVATTSGTTALMLGAVGARRPRAAQEDTLSRLYLSGWGKRCALGRIRR